MLNIFLLEKTKKMITHRGEIIISFMPIKTQALINRTLSSTRLTGISTLKGTYKAGLNAYRPKIFVANTK